VLGPKEGNSVRWLEDNPLRNLLGKL